MKHVNFPSEGFMAGLRPGDEFTCDSQYEDYVTIFADEMHITLKFDVDEDEDLLYVRIENMEVIYADYISESGDNFWDLDEMFWTNALEAAGVENKATGRMIVGKVQEEEERMVEANPDVFDPYVLRLVFGYNKVKERARSMVEREVDDDGQARESSGNGGYYGVLLTEALDDAISAVGEETVTELLRQAAHLGQHMTVQELLNLEVTTGDSPY